MGGNEGLCRLSGKYIDFGIKGCIRYAFSVELITDALWMGTITDRSRTLDAYKAKTAREIASNVVAIYYPLFCEFESTMEEFRTEKQ